MPKASSKQMKVTPKLIALLKYDPKLIINQVDFAKKTLEIYKKRISELSDYLRNHKATQKEINFLKKQEKYYELLHIELIKNGGALLNQIDFALIIKNSKILAEIYAH
jgi:predicted component of type VI protein secretion system